MNTDARSELREIRKDMHRGCDDQVVHRCPYCHGTTHALSDSEPPTCDCDYGMEDDDMMRDE
jgi:hypothetical protein